MILEEFGGVGELGREAGTIDKVLRTAKGH